MITRTKSTSTVAGLAVTEWPGSGPVVLGLPGLSSSATAWGPLAAALPDARVVSVDLRGRGASRDLDGPTGLRAHAQDVAAVLADLDIVDVTVVGHSMGAFLAPLVVGLVFDDEYAHDGPMLGVAAYRDRKQKCIRSGNGSGSELPHMNRDTSPGQTAGAAHDRPRHR